MPPPSHCTFDMVQRAERAGSQPVALLSRIVGRRPEPQSEGQRLRFCGLRGAELRDSALCREPALLRRAEAALLHGYPVVLSGCFVPAPGDEGPPELLLQDIEPALRAADLLCPRPEERLAARERLAALRAASARDPDALLAHVLSEAQVLLGLRAGASPHYERLQLGLVLQALSGGAAGPGEGEDLAGRLSALLLASPGRKKRTLALQAQLLSPVAMMAQGATLTAAELVGAAAPEEDGLLREPGMLVRGDGGVVILEDFHALRRHREPVQRALCQALEERRVTPLGAGPAAPALRSDAALYIDLSLDAALHGALPGRASQTLLDTPDFAAELLPRMDLVACVDAGKDGDRSERQDLWSEAERPPPRPVEEDLVQRRRDLQLLLCLVRDAIPRVELDAVAEELVSGFFDRSAALGAGARGLDAAAFLRRSSLSLRRLCAASARLRLRERAGPEDAQTALSLFSLKIETLTWLFQARAQHA